MVLQDVGDGAGREHRHKHTQDRHIRGIQSCARLGKYERKEAHGDHRRPRAIEEKLYVGHPLVFCERMLDGCVVQFELALEWLDSTDDGEHKNEQPDERQVGDSPVDEPAASLVPVKAKGDTIEAVPVEMVEDIFCERHVWCLAA